MTCLSFLFKVLSRPLMICDSYPLGIINKSQGIDANDNLLGNIQNTQIGFITSAFFNAFLEPNSLQMYPKTG